ncbi:unnamed protein product [Paramecium octaurelia]|uniref:WD repeat-containing protein 65 n=1 Tax=Paramecium octaurelia TaxID=43137 RepID=A0A8S1W490_PAROT|nr:unnamed protein product [Paramecium octaurelia]
MSQPENKQPKPLKEVLGLKYVFGFRGDIKNSILQGTQTNVQEKSTKTKFIYPAANNIVIFDPIADKNKSQEIIQTVLGSKGVTCLTISLSRRYIAWSEESDAGIIVILDLNTRKTKILSTTDCKSRYYVSLDFSRTEESKYLVALSAPPEQMLIHWAWDKSKCLGSTIINAKGDSIKFHQVFYHPKEDDFVCVMGNGAIKPYKLIPDNPPKPKDSPFQKKKEETHSTNFLSYCILSDSKTMVVGTDRGEVLYFNENCEFKLVLSPLQNSNQQSIEGFPIECIVKYSNGFIVGGSDCMIYIYRKHEGDLKNPYVRIDKRIQNKQILAKITSLCLTNQEDNLIFGVESGQVFSIPFSADREVANEDEIKFDHLIAPFHSGPITGLDVCTRKSLVVTVSDDRSIRIWNFNELILEVMKECEDTPLAVAIHPSGFHLIVSFSDKIVLYNLFEKDLNSFKEIHIKNCQQIKFAHGGHLFAVANQNLVQIYQFYTGENPQNYIFKQSTGNISTIEWDIDDLGFYTGSDNGFVLYWRLEDNQNKLQLAMIQSQPIECICTPKTYANIELQKVYIAGPYDGQYCIYESQHHTKIHKEATEGTKKEIPLYPIQTGCRVSKMAIFNSEKIMLFATCQLANSSEFTQKQNIKNMKFEPGGLRFAKYPLAPEEIIEIQPHIKGITQMKVSYDDSYVFTASYDNSLIIYDVKDQSSKIEFKDGGQAYGVQAYADEFLMQRDQYKKKIAKIEDLKQKIKEHDINQKIKQNMYTKEKDELIRKLEEQIDQLEKREKAKIQELENAINKLDSDFKEEKKQLYENHEKNKKTTENDFKQKMALESQRLEELTKEKQLKLQEFQRYIKEQKDKSTETKNEKKKEYEKQLRKEQQLYVDLQKDKEDNQKKFIEERNKLEDDAEKEIDKKKEINEAEMKKLSDELDKAELEKRTKKTEFDNVQSTLEQANSKVKEIMEDIAQNQELNRQYQKEKESHDKEIKERDKTIQDKQKRIYELKKKTQELEKFKFVLDYKIKELKRDIGPREEEITKMKEQITNMNTEILHFKKVNANLGLIVTDLNLRQAGMKQEIENQQQVIESNSQYIKAFEYDISETHAHINDFKRLKSDMLKLFNKYVQSVVSKKKFENVDVQKEFIKERAHLETTNKGLKEKFSKKLRVHKQDNNRIMSQNVDLISEINDLRREIKLLQDEEDLKRRQIEQMNDQPEERELDQMIEEQEIEINQYREKLQFLKEAVQQRRLQQNINSDSDHQEFQQE